MKKKLKIKDLTIEKFISIARKSRDSHKSDDEACVECPFAKVEDLECRIYCTKHSYPRKRIDDVINQEIEVEE